MSEEEPQAKKAKVVKAEGEKEAADAEDADEQETEDVWKSNQNGDAYFEISGKKRCTLRVYNGTPLVDIREYYDKNGEMMPGKKGISLTKAQWEALSSRVDVISEKLNDLK